MASFGRRAVLATSNMARKLGSTLDAVGASLEVSKYCERLVPSTRFVAVDELEPQLDAETLFVAPSASVIGDVKVGKNSSVWYGAVVRGDVNSISIGENSSVGDRAVVHVAKIQGDFCTTVGDAVTIEAGAIVHACTVGDRVVVGAGAQVLDGAVIEKDVVLAPGSIVPPGTTVNGGQLWGGSPAVKIRDLSPEEVESIVETAEDVADLAELHAVECNKDYKMLARDEEIYQDDLARSEEYYPRPEPGSEDREEVLGQGTPGRIFDSTLTNPERAYELLNKQNKNKP